MSDRKLDDFLVKRTAAAMERIEEEIYKEVRGAVCEHFGVVSIRNLTDDQVKQIKEAKEEHKKKCKGQKTLDNPTSALE